MSIVFARHAQMVSDAWDIETACLEWLDEPDERVIDEFRMVECSIMPDGSIGVGGHVIKESSQ